MEETKGVVAETTTIIKQFAELSKNQQQKYAHLKGIYSDEDEILKLVQLIEPRGENSWKRATDKIDNLRHGDYKDQMYTDALYENFEIGKMYTSPEIICTVGIVRRDLGLQTYISSLKKNCENDFFKLFVFSTVTTEVCCVDTGPDAGKMKTLIVGYIPTFRLKPEE